MNKTITMLAALVASATIAGCADTATQHRNATAGGAVPIAVPSGAANACQADAMPDDALIGKTEADAAALLDGCLWRVLERDGRSLPGTVDYRAERRDLGVRDGKVIWVRRG